jgi:hypothetical protein
MTFNDDNEMHAQLSMQSIEDIHAANIDFIKEILDRTTLDEFLKTINNDAKDSNIEISDMLAVDIATAIENDVTITDTEPTDTEGHCIDGEAVYKNEKFFFHDSVYSDSTSWKQGAAIDLVRSKLHIA